MYSKKLSIYGEKDILEAAVSHVQIYLEGVSEEENHFDLYVDQKKKNKVNTIILNLSNKYNFQFLWSTIKHKNWQDNWKKYFTTIEVNNFFTVLPNWEENAKVNTLHKIIIHPAMAFGTGHHESTFMILDLLPSIVKSRDKVIDVGTGSGILLIASMKLGASKGVGIEYDSVCKENFEKNMQTNGINKNVSYLDTSFTKISKYSCDVLLANLNKKLILTFLNRVKVFPPKMIISGILYSDLEQMENSLNKLKLKIKRLKKKNEWICLLIEK